MNQLANTILFVLTLGIGWISFPAFPSLAQNGQLNYVNIHESIEAGVEAIYELGNEHNFSVEATEDASIFNEASLQQFNVVVFLNTTGDVLNETQQIELNRFIQAGGGYVGIHAAADTEYDWPWYGELVGGWFKSHPLDPNVREATIEVVDPDHDVDSAYTGP